MNSYHSTIINWQYSALTSLGESQFKGKKKINNHSQHPTPPPSFITDTLPSIFQPLFFDHLLFWSSTRHANTSTSTVALLKKREKRKKQRLKEGGLQPMSIPVVSEVTAAQWSHWQQRCTRRSAHAGMWDIVMVQSDRNGSRRVTARPLNTLIRCWYFWMKCGVGVTESKWMVTV